MIVNKTASMHHTHLKEAFPVNLICHGMDQTTNIILF